MHNAAGAPALGDAGWAGPGVVDAELVDRSIAELRRL